jgi:DNA-binding response OmpR family regulator
MLLDEEMTKRILIIEDDPQTLRLITHFLHKHKHVDSQGTGLLEEGKKLILDFNPHLIISDINLPDGLGHSILTMVGELEKTIPVIFISGYYQTYEKQIPLSSHIAFMKKPLSLQALWDNIKEMLYQDDGSFPFRLSDYIQLSSQGRHSVVIEWEGQGKIILNHGELWSASDSQGKGEHALKRMVVRSEIYRDGGAIVCRRISNIEDEPRSIFTTVEAILLQAISEEEELLATIPGTGSGFSTTIREQAQFEILLEDGVSFLLSKQFSKALTCFLSANKIKPDNKTIQINISRLREMGVEPEEEL